MSFFKQDLRRSNGSPFYYASVYEWQQKETTEGLGTYPISGGIGSALTLTDLDDLIENIYFAYDVMGSTGTFTTQIANVGIAAEDLISDFLVIYQDRLVASPFYQSHATTEWDYVVRHIKNQIVAAFNINMAKYIKLLESMGYKYDPTANYDMTEISGDAEKEGILEDNKSIRGSKVKTETAPETQVKHYTTTYDDAATGRLDSYDVQQYNGTYKVDQGNVPIKETKEYYEGEDPGDTIIRKHNDQVSLTVDDITTPNADKANTHKLIRRGNIGVTTTQQMIEAQRELVKFSLEREILKDIEDAILLKTYG